MQLSSDKGISPVEALFTRRPWLVPVILAVLTVIFLRIVIFPPETGQVLDSGDLVGQFYPIQYYIQQSVRSGTLPLWNPHQFIGQPIAGNPQTALFYPVTWWTWLVGVLRGINLSLAFHTWFAAWGMSRLARS